MVHGRIWPAHPKPLPDELLSSWIVRVAQANGIKLQTLCWMLFGNERSPWNRDIDRSAPKWLLKAMCEHTGTNYWGAYHATLTTYRGRLYPYRKRTGNLRWILPLRSYGMKRSGFGMQFCPLCLASDPIPYFRKHWRVALFTYCPHHQVSLRDACPGCGLPIMHYRGDFGRELWDARPIHVCHACGFDFRECAAQTAYFHDEEVHRQFNRMLLSFDGPISQAGPFNLEFFAVLRQLCLMVDARQNHGKLQHFVAGQFGIPPLPLSTMRLAVEQRSLIERHETLLCGLWLIGGLAQRMRDAWLAKAIRYNLMLKDFEDAPKWYRHLVKQFSDWRQSSSAAEP